MGDAAYAFGFDDGNGESPQTRNIFWTVTRAYAATVLVIVPINNVMAAVFDAPVAPVCFKYLLSIGLFGSSTSDAVGDFT